MTNNTTEVKTNKTERITEDGLRTSYVMDNNSEVIIINKYDDRRNCVYHHVLKWDLKEWYEYDERNNLIHYHNNDGEFKIKDYDERNNLIHYKDDKGYEEWNMYDENNFRFCSRNNRGKYDVYSPNADK